MSDNIKLPPLPEWAKADNLGGMVPSEIRLALNDYARAAVELNAYQWRKIPDHMPPDVRSLDVLVTDVEGELAIVSASFVHQASGFLSLWAHLPRAPEKSNG